MSAPPLAPLVVGVTGHRDLRPYDVGRLRALVGRELDKLLKQSPDTPLMVLSPLAEGADRLVAREALARRARLMVLLPLEQKDYEEDFETEESLIEFRELLGKAETVLTLPQGYARDHQYAMVGACVARHSDILIALWDGENEAGVGGTAQIVRFRLHGRFEDDDLQEHLQRLADPFGPSNDPLGRDESGLVVHIFTPHSKQPKPSRPFEVKVLAPKRFEVRQFSTTNRRRNTFNKDLKRFWQVTEEDRKNHEIFLFPHLEAQQLSAVLRALRQQQAGADVLATLFQKRTKRAAITLNVVLFIAAIAYTLYSNLMPEDARKDPWSLVYYLLLLALGGVVYLIAKIRRVQSKFLDYRAVAEGLRVQFYWGVAGLWRSAADHYLRRQKGELAWISHVLRPWAMPLCAPSQLTQPLIEMVRKCWIQGQAQYFRDKTCQKRDLLLALSALRNILVLASISLAAVIIALFAESTAPILRTAVLLSLATAAALLLTHLVNVIRDLGTQSRPGGAFSRLARGSYAGVISFGAMLVILLELWRRRNDQGLWASILDSSFDVWMMAAMELALIAAALVYGYVSFMALSDESKQYERMEKIFNQAFERSKAHGLEALLEPIGKEALAENGEWVLMHRERPLELQHP